MPYMVSGLPGSPQGTLLTLHRRILQTPVDVVGNPSLQGIFTVESNIETTVLSWYSVTTMKFLGILRASALCLLVSAFHGSRGVFCSNLEVYPSAESPTVEVPEISENLEDSAVESSSASSAPAPKSDLVFESSEWDDSQLASAALFINEFCSLVNAENFGGNLKVLNDVKDNKDAQWLSVKVKSLCSNFSSRLESLSANLVPSGVTINPYKDALKPEKFNTYAEWLVKNIPGIRESVQKMFNESKKLNKAQLKTETSMGPSKYGFEFVGDKWKPFVHYNLKDLTWCLRATLEYLQKYLDKILKDPQCEKASTTRKFLSLFSRGKKSDVNPKQEDSTVKSQAVEDAEHKDA